MESNKSIVSQSKESLVAGSNEQHLFDKISVLIDQSKRKMHSQMISGTVLLFWEIGTSINTDILENKRADYGKKIVSQLAMQLETKYGRSFDEKNVRRMLQFSEKFSDKEIVVTLSRQLSWSHFLALIPLKSQEAQMYYAHEAFKGNLGVRGLRELIARKAYERKEIADAQIAPASPIPLGTFKDPYLFDVLGIKDEYLEADVEDAILRELEKFILEFGKGFAFVERQKRMIVDGTDKKLDLLFYNRNLRRLVAVELKYGKFDAKHKGQMELYLKWLNRYEKKEGENEPIGIILCSESGREEVELLEMSKSGIMVAEYWTTLPPKAEFEQKIQDILAETRERMAQRHQLIDNQDI